jgi:CubicO group peptidase (beta-lactamase class C family)
MSLFQYLPSLERRTCAALLPVVLLISVLVSAMGGAPVRALRATPPPPSPTGLSDPHELETFLDRVISMQLADNHIPGATVAVVKEGRLFFARGYGDADWQHGKLVSAETTLFRIGSVSKLFTWTAVMQLAEQGKVNLHADVNTYLKTFHIPATYPQPITLAHLLTHTAGFEDRGTGIYARTTRDLKPLDQWLAEHIPARVRPPGELTAYSNYGAALAGYIVEQVSGLPFEQYVEQHLFQPLGMRSSTFRQPVPGDLAAALSQGYTYTNGEYRSEPFEAVQVAPAGSMSATATDIANFMIAHLQNGRFGNQRILQEATAKEMHAQQFTNDPRVPGMAYGFWEQQLNHQRLLVHGGDTTLFHSWLALLPEQQVGVFVSYNSAEGGSAPTTLLQAFLDHYFPASQELTPPPPAGFAERASQISGNYWSTLRSYTTYEKLAVLSATTHVSVVGNSRLAISAGDQTFTVVEVTPWVFQQVDGQERVVFRPKGDGMVMLIASTPIYAYTRVAWYDAPTAHMLLVVVCVLLFLSALLLWPLGFVLRAARRRARSRKVGRGVDREGVQTAAPAPQGEQTSKRMAGGLRPWLARWLAGVLCTLNVLFLLGLGLILSNPADLAFGVTPLLTTLFILALVSAILSVGVVILAFLAWGERFWSVGGRVHYTLVVMATLAFTWELVYWNLLGMRA